MEAKRHFVHPKPNLAPLHNCSSVGINDMSELGVLRAHMLYTGCQSPSTQCSHYVDELTIPSQSIGHCKKSISRPANEQQFEVDGTRRQFMKCIVLSDRNEENRSKVSNRSAGMISIRFPGVSRKHLADTYRVLLPSTSIDPGLPRKIFCTDTF